MIFVKCVYALVEQKQSRKKTKHKKYIKRKFKTVLYALRLSCYDRLRVDLLEDKDLQYQQVCLVVKITIKIIMFCGKKLFQ